LLVDKSVQNGGDLQVVRLGAGCRSHL
jgi:hypothetical protein